MGLGVEGFGCIGEILCYVVVVVTVANTSSFAKCDGVWISCCVRFLVPLRFSCCMMVEFKLFFPILSGRNEF